MSGSSFGIFLDNRSVHALGWKWTEVSVVPGDFPIEEDIFHLWPLTNVVNDHVSPRLWRLRIHHDPNMINFAPKIPGDKITGRIILDEQRSG